LREDDLLRDSKILPYTLSHDPDDLPTYTHETVITNNLIGFNTIVAIVDENKDHYPYLLKWMIKEIDVETRYWVHDGQLGGWYRIYDGPNSYTLEYIFKLTVEQAKLITQTILNPIGVCNKENFLLFIGQSMSIQDLKDLIHYKDKVDNLPKVPKFWKVG